MNRGELRTALKARNLRDIADSLLNQALNDAETEFQEWYSWPWTEATETGPAPLTIPDLGRVTYVVDTDNDHRLARTDLRQLVATFDTDLTRTGTADFWYRDGVTDIKVFPISTANLEVRYQRAPAVMDDDADSPLSPSRYHSVIVDLSEALVLERHTNNPDLAAARRQAATLRVLAVAQRVMIDGVEPLTVERDDWS